jgi:hypothetical protein
MAMSEEHKAALAVGRKESRAIKAYLEALASRKPGRPVTPESLRQKIERISAKLADESDALKRVELVQQRLDAEDALASVAEVIDMAALEAGFVESVAGYSQRKGITYSAWRASGVPAEVLKRSGVPRTRRS